MIGRTKFLFFPVPERSELFFKQCEDNNKNNNTPAAFTQSAPERTQIKKRKTRNVFTHTKHLGRAYSSTAHRGSFGPDLYPILDD